MRLRRLAMAIENGQKRCETCSEKEGFRLKASAFIRERKLSAQWMIQLILQRIYQSLQLHLDRFYEKHTERTVSKQAFSKARQFLNPEFVRGYADDTAEIAVKTGGIPGYRGMPLIALDGSGIALENSPELKEAFGCSGSHKDAATALCSVAYGPLDHVIYDCRLDRYDCDERDLAKAHIKRLKELGLGGSLLLFDRGYPSAEMIAHLYENGFQFVMRVRKKWNLAADTMRTQGWIRIENEGETYPVRVLKVRLSTGEMETLVTSLNQKQLPIVNAGALYFERWKVETAYDLLKSKMQLENFSGKTRVSVLQDFYATIYLSNLVAFAAADADEEIATADEGKLLKHKRQASRNRTVAKLRDIFLCLLMEPDAQARRNMLDNLISSIARYPVAIVPDRSPPRKPPRMKRFFLARKSVV